MLMTRSPAPGARSSLSPPGVGPIARGVLERMEEAEWISAGVLHERYLKDVFHYVQRRVSRQEEAEDITAEVFAAAFIGLPRFHGHCPPYLWLLSIARRKIVDARRRRSARRETLASELGDQADDAGSEWEGLLATEGPETMVTREEGRQVLHRLMAGLKEDQREALSLQYWERLSIADIAVVMGRSPAAVNSLLQRARAALYRRGRGYFLGDDEGTGHDR
jgi:RNA polymerase sigma-70 factor (ECF subfamily)